MFRNAKYFKYVFMSQPRVRWAGRRSSAAVDMFARGAAVTVTLFHSAMHDNLFHIETDYGCVDGT